MNSSPSRSWILSMLALVALAAVDLARPAVGAPTAHPMMAAEVSPQYALDAVWPLPAAPAMPLDVALADEGQLFVADGRHNSVKVFDAAGRLSQEWAFDPDGELLVPSALAVDQERDLVHVLWSAYSLGAGGTSYVGLRLDTRRLDGSSTRPLRALSQIPAPADMAILPGAGDLMISAGPRVYRVRQDSTWTAGSFESGVDGARLAVLAADKVAIVQPDAGSIRFVTPEGIPVGGLSVSGSPPVAAAGTESGDLMVLLRAPETDDPSRAGLLVYGPQGQLKETRSLASLGMPAMAAAPWPWAIASSATGFALTSGHLQFHTLRYSAAGGLLSRLVGAPFASPFLPRVPDVDLRPNLALSPGPDGRLMVLDGQDGRLVSVSDGGQARVAGALPADAVDLSAGEDDDVFVTTRSGQLMRLPIGEAITPLWSIPCRCELGGRLASNPLAVYVTQPRAAEVGAYSPEDGQRLRPYSLPEIKGLWPSDVADGPGGLLYTADMVAAQVQAWRRTEYPDGVWQAGLLAGPRRIAVGQWDELTVVAALLADGFIELHDARTGRLMARWEPSSEAGAAPDLVDIAVGRDGQVYVADAEARAIRVYGPGLGIGPTEEPRPSASATPSALSCTIRGDRVSAAGPVVLGATAPVTLSLSADCPNSSRVLGADLVLVMDRSSSMSGQAMVAAKGAARRFVELLDTRYHRVGLVSFSDAASLDVPLTDQIPALLDGLDRLAPDGGTDLGEAILAARGHLERSGRAEALPVMIVLTDGQVGAADDPRAPAREARSWGIQIFAVGLGAAPRELLEDLAGGADRAFVAPSPSELYPIYRQILRQVLTSLAGSLVITEPMIGPLTYEPGSARPMALEGADGLQWGRTLLPRSGITLSYQVRAVRDGCHSLSPGSRAEYTDADGVRRRFDFPIPTVCVVTPSPTPSPSPSPTASPSPSATPSPEPRPIFLPMLNGCRASAHPVDVVLLLDSSSSMTGAKQAESKLAAKAFLELLDLGRDQAAVIGFHSQAILASGLSANPGTLGRAVDGLALGAGTRIDRALQAAVAELLSQRRRPGNQGLIVLLSDGAHSGTSAELKRAVGGARNLGAVIYAVGFGADVNRAELIGIAGPDRTYIAADGRALERIYREIASAIPCR